MITSMDVTITITGAGHDLRCSFGKGNGEADEQEANPVDSASRSTAQLLPDGAE
jgi:hypothetical protein